MTTHARAIGSAGLPIIVAVRSTHDAVNVLARGQLGVLGESRQVRGALGSNSIRITGL